LFVKYVSPTTIDEDTSAFPLRRSVTGFGDFHSTTPIFPRDGHWGMVVHCLQKGRESGQDGLRRGRVGMHGFNTCMIHTPNSTLHPVGFHSTSRSGPYRSTGT
jgi:hypothetical protein